MLSFKNASGYLVSGYHHLLSRKDLILSLRRDNCVSEKAGSPAEHLKENADFRDNLVDSRTEGNTTPDSEKSNLL